MWLIAQIKVNTLQKIVRVVSPYYIQDHAGEVNYMDLPMRHMFEFIPYIVFSLHKL